MCMQGGSVSVTLDTSSCTASCMITVCYAASTAGLPGRPITDNMNNTWTEVVGTKQRETDDLIVWMWTTITPGGPRVGAKHEFTATGYGPSIVAMAFNGVASGPDKANSSTHPIPPLVTAFTPSNPNELIVPCMAYANTDVELATPFVTLDNLKGHGPNSAPGTGVAAGWHVATGSGEVAASWNYSKYSYIAASMASWYGGAQIYISLSL